MPLAGRHRAFAPFVPAAVLAAMIATTAPLRAQTQVDLELVLAIDGSASIDEGEFALEMQGYANAFRDEEVQAAITGGLIGTIAVSTLLWADASVPTQPGQWFEISNADDAEVFAQSLERTQRRVQGGTGIGAGVAEAIRMLDRNGFDGLRQIVDVSGDGVETPPRQTVIEMPQARAMAEARGVTVNGLAILNEMPYLDRWYRTHVITGPSAFVMMAANFRDFQRAIKRKLLKEIRGLPDVAGLPELSPMASTEHRSFRWTGAVPSMPARRPSRME